MSKDYGRILFEAGQKYVVEELGNAIRESWENMEPEYKAAHAAAAEAVIKAAIPEGLHHELAGVITDYENGKTFDEVSLQTIKRVHDELLAIYDHASATTPPALDPRISELLENVRRISGDLEYSDGTRRSVDALQQAERKLIDALLAAYDPTT